MMKPRNFSYKIDFSSQNSATIADERRDQAEGDYTATAREGGKPATPFEAPALAAVSGSPITARVPPNRSQFSEDDRSNVVITQPRQKFEVGKTYIFIVQAKASAQLKGQGSAAALGNDNRKLVLKEIKIDW